MPFEAQIPLIKIANDQAVLPDGTSQQAQESDFIGWDKDTQQYYRDVTRYLENANEMVEGHHRKGT